MIPWFFILPNISMNLRQFVHSVEITARPLLSISYYKYFNIIEKNAKLKVYHAQNIICHGNYEGQRNISPHEPNDECEDDGIDQLAIELHCISYEYILF